ncbi:MAG: 4-hydroxy-tetrahydrodipicolinate synthase [Actinomycetota bacterium]|nr:4-hydroxy-tetrahydrodipicolinate synthase [Actinomycetota bacterium]MDK1096496.1 4-hydroxy-tetrahydrodipicolinate synthase [Actinomycetota bacterium]MDK1291724.1 4-hydroxy-tetrahydrodipicolinate synthase [Actinomycetota bacterium]
MEHRPEAVFGRVATAIITPFTSEGPIDYAAFWRLVRHLAENGTEAIVVAGTTGESPTLSKPEKVALFAAAVDAAGDRVKVVAGGTNSDTAESIDFAVAAAEVGVDGVMVVTPYYSKPPQHGIVAHMVAIADATDLPVMIYNIPGRTATLIEIDTLVEICEHPNVVAVKDAVDDIEWSRRAIQALPEGIAVYSGSDALTKDLVNVGAVGVVSVASHLAGREIAAMVDAILSGDDAKAEEMHRLLTPLNEALFLEPSPMPLKGALTAYWDSVGEPRLPLMPAKPETVAAVGDALTPINKYRSA